MTNVTGWTELMEGNIVLAAIAALDAAFLGWFVPILFFTTQGIILLTTRSLNLLFVLGMFFVSIYTGINAVSGFIMTPEPFALFIIGAALSLELGAIIFTYVMNKNR